MATDKRLEKAIGTEGMEKLYPHGTITASNNQRTLREEVVRHRFGTCRDLLRRAQLTRSRWTWPWKCSWDSEDLERALAILTDTRP